MENNVLRPRRFSQIGNDALELLTVVSGSRGKFNIQQIDESDAASATSRDSGRLGPTVAIMETDLEDVYERL